MASEPNFAVIAQCLDGIKHEVGLLPNIIPLTAAMFRQEMQLTLGTILSELRTEIAAMRAEMGEMRAEMGAEIGQLRAEMGQLQVGAGQFRAEVGHLHTQIGQLREEFRESQRLLPIRLHNATAGDGAPLRYPPGVTVENGMPVTQQDVLTLSAEGCQQTSAALGLPPVPNQTVILRRSQIAEYLGVPLQLQTPAPPPPSG